MKPILKDQQHRNLAFWGMAMIAMGLPLSVFLVSVGTFVLAGNWLLEGTHFNRLKQFFTDPLSLAISAIFLIHCIGLLWTEDLEWGSKDIRVKLPLLILPLILFTSKLPSKKRLEDVLKLFVVACIVGTIFGLPKYFELTGELQNSRHVSVFISHIRFGLMLVLAFFILSYYLFAKWRDWSVAEKLVCTAAMLWTLWFIVILEAFTAYLAFGALLVFTSFRLLLKQQNKKIAIGLVLLTLVLTSASVVYVGKIVNNHYAEVPFNFRTLTVKTLNGNYYAHQTNVPFRENGHRVWNFVCWKELKQEWPKRSSMSFDGTDERGQELRFTLIRYMSSKGLLKDSVGLHQLSDLDVANVERGFTNYLYTDKLGVSRKINELLRGWDKYNWEEAASGSSAFQRLVYLDVGLEIFKNNLLLGVGTGDIVASYKAEYIKDDRGLEKRFQGISHNQFLTIGITLGIIGVLVFLVSIFYPAWVYRKDYLYMSLLILMLVSFMTDNTLDRQAGVTLFAFFNALFIIRREFAET